jgi:hypothetical protein
MDYLMFVSLFIKAKSFIVDKWGEKKEKSLSFSCSKKKRH